MLIRLRVRFARTIFNSRGFQQVLVWYRFAIVRIICSDLCCDTGIMLEEVPNEPFQVERKDEVKSGCSMQDARPLR